MNVEIGAEAALFPEKEYILGIFVAVWNENIKKNHALCSLVMDSSPHPTVSYAAIMAASFPSLFVSLPSFCVK